MSWKRILAESRNLFTAKAMCGRDDSIKCMRDPVPFLEENFDGFFRIFLLVQKFFRGFWKTGWMASVHVEALQDLFGLVWL